MQTNGGKADDPDRNISRLLYTRVYVYSAISTYMDKDEESVTVDGIKIKRHSVGCNGGCRYDVQCSLDSAWQTIEELGEEE